MDITKYKMRVYIEGSSTSPPTPNIPHMLLGTVLHIIPMNKRTEDAMKDPLNLPFIICGFRNIKDWRCAIMVRWDNDMRGEIGPCQATLYSTTIRMCNSLWEDEPWKILRARKMIDPVNFKPKTVRRSLLDSLKQTPILGGRFSTRTMAKRNVYEQAYGGKLEWIEPPVYYTSVSSASSSDGTGIRSAVFDVGTDYSTTIGDGTIEPIPAAIGEWAELRNPWEEAMEHVVETIKTIEPPIREAEDEPDF